MKSLSSGGLLLDSLANQTLLPGTKGLPLTRAMRQGDIGTQGWNVLDGDTSFPVALLKQSALTNNLDWMRQFCVHAEVQLAPHGKTTMCPQLFDAQLANGAWGLTLATMNQVQIAYRFGVKRILLANQLVAPSDIRMALSLLADPAVELYVLVDSHAAITRLSDAIQAASTGSEQPLRVLVELGFAGGRTGCRSSEQAVELAKAVAATPGLQLAGIEGYEGLLVSGDRNADLVAVRAFVRQLLELTMELDAAGLFAAPQILLSAGGSAYFDLVGSGFFSTSNWSRPLLPILRSGCYVTHDHGFYHGLIAEMQARDESLPKGGLRPALEIWSMVQSRPEPTLAILTMGKRDASYDIELPIPLMHHRPLNSGSPCPLPAGCRIEKMNDQHAYLRLPSDSDLCSELKVGDLLSCGISHPCTTFDKWPVLLVVDDDYVVQHAVNTFF
jgi:D-serine dehydratase